MPLSRLDINCFRLLFIISITINCYSQEKNLELDLTQKKVLVVYGGWKGHQPEKFATKISAWLHKHNAQVTMSKSTAIYKDKEAMEGFDLIIQHITMSQLATEETLGLLAAIKNGTGIAGCHGGLGDSFRNNTDFQYMVGGQFVKHPGGETNYEVKIIDHDDPITKGITDFKLKTEQYYMHVDPNIKVLATTRFSNEHDHWIEDAVIPVVWKKYFGNGRVFYNAIGHSEDLFEREEVWSLITRGVYWAAQGKTAPKEKWISPVYSRF